MAAGKAIVTTTIGSNREVTGDGEAAVLVPPKDPVALARAIQGLMADDLLRQELARKAEQEQVRRYGLDRMLQAYLAEYETLISRNTGAPIRSLGPLRRKAQ
jgi:glycosyltransferase involved in cell wall biosynthesis